MPSSKLKGSICVIYLIKKELEYIYLNRELSNKFRPTNCICEARDLELVRPLLMTKNTEILVLNEITASALGA